MRLDNDYIVRYRSVPAASSTEELPENAIPYLPRAADTEQFYLSTPMHYHPEIEIIFVEAGQWHYRCASSAHFSCAEAGDLVIFPPYEPHEAAIREHSGGYITRCICFDTKLLTTAPGEEGASLVHSMTLSDGGLPIHIRHSDDINETLGKTFSAMLGALDAPGHCEELLFFGSLCTLFGLLNQQNRILPFAADPDPAVPSVTGQKFARTVIDYTEAHFAEPLSTAVTAAALNYSEAYFCRMFRRVFHMCYSDYVSRLRIAKVRQLLSAMSVTDAAIACGFTHMSRFSKTFRRCTGMSPTEFKRTLTR
ncbi:MAG: helix-turn-helix transcriptional regulator [Clostridia bacterium]|nr:helix-turn-helix transcriptional regulator [Clostridia bacterium]